MSFYLLPDTQIDRTLIKQYQFYEGKTLKYHLPQLTQKQVVNFEAQAKKLGEQTTHVIRQNNESKQFIAMIGATLPNYKNFISIEFNKLTHHIRIKMKLLTPQETYFQVRNIRSLCQLFVKVRNFLKYRNLNLVQGSFNMNNGKFSMRFPIYTGSQAYFQGVISKGESLIEYIYKNYVEGNLSLLKFIIFESNRQFQVNANLKQNYLDSTQRYLDLSHVRTLITQSSVISEQQITKIERERKFDFEQTIKNKINIGQQFLKLNTLFYLDNCTKIYGIPKYHFNINQEEQRFIGSKIAMPIQPKPKSSAQNLLVLNYIYICDLGGLRLKKIDEGGFSSIFLTDIKYLCVYPTPGYEMLRFNQADLSNHRNILIKRVIVKKEDEDCSFSRNRHELQIIKSIKEPSVFLPKYYVILNKPNPHTNAVVMDYIPFQNLTEHMGSNINSMSLRTKLILIFSIIQALRFLRDQRIVHLDLKPNNIMIYHNLLVKLIDFGQSYQPQVCSKKHKPGFTIPYSSPEIFSNETKYFTTKSDVFSLGVIMFEILYRSYPYDIFEETELIDSIMSNYLKKWLFAPEEFQKYGDIKILRIMNACISRCLSPVINHRPELDWLAIIIRSCIEYIE